MQITMPLFSCLVIITEISNVKSLTFCQLELPEVKFMAKVLSCQHSQITTQFTQYISNADSFGGEGSEGE
jgi:hypothetical protein